MAPGTKEVRQELASLPLPRSASWAEFEADAEERRPARGPYFPALTEASLGFLLPLIRLADARTPRAEWPELVRRAAAFFGSIHEHDAELAWHLWKQDTAPGLAALLGEAPAAEQVVAFYRRVATETLLVLALRFEYAALLGLGLDDVGSPPGPVAYEVEATWGEVLGRASSRVVPGGAYCSPQPPATLTLDRVPGTVRYPAFAAWPNWHIPAGFAPMDAEERPLRAATTVPRVPAPWSALTWSEPAGESEIIGYGPVLYEILRFHDAAVSAGVTTTPPLPAGAAFASLCRDAIRPSSPPHFQDGPGKDWPPLEGHYHYEVRGIDLLGTVSVSGTRATIRHFDDLPPASPRAHHKSGAAVTIAGAGATSVPLAIEWDAAEDFEGPDVAEFRVLASFTPLLTIPVHIEEVTTVSLLTADLRITNLPLPVNAAVGASLSLPNGDFPIVSHGTGPAATMRVRQVMSRVPARGDDGVITTAGASTPFTRVAKLARRPAVAATVTAAMLGPPLELTLVAELGQALPGSDVRAYVHLLRESFDAIRTAADTWRIDAPPDESPSFAAWKRLMDAADGQLALIDSPVILFPPHSLDVPLTTPAGFVAGFVTLGVVAADRAAYVASASLPIAAAGLASATGNESSRADVVLSLRSTAPPDAPAVGPWRPIPRQWASTAAAYAEEARYEVTWMSVPGAARYQVRRALEGALIGVTAATTDADLRTLGLAQPAAFEVRSDRVFGSSYVDELPGRAPTRALYRIHAVSAAGIIGPASELVGPVHVPDARPPARPNLLRAAAAPPNEAERAIAVEWTQAGPTIDVRFDVFFRPDTDGARFALAGTVPRGTAPGAVGRFRFVHVDRQPGQRLRYRIEAVREALDPVDPTASARRDIRSLPSEERFAFAISSAPLSAPSGLTAVVDGAMVVLTWANRDGYERIEVRRRPPGRNGFATLATLPGTATEYRDTTVSTGTWQYELRTVAFSRPARSPAPVEVTVP